MSSALKILYIAEIVGKPGIFTLKTLLPSLKKDYAPHLVVACADGATGGFGLGKNHAFYLHKLGINILTGGEWIYNKKDLHEILDKSSHILRPANFPAQAPGKGWKILDIEGQKVAVVCLMGQAGFSRTHASSPFHGLDYILQQIADKCRPHKPIVVVDFHAATTAEKQLLFYHARGRVAAVIGSHQKVLTADAHILEEGTAVITDAGRTGSQLSVGGFNPALEIQQICQGFPERSEESWEGLELQGVLIEITTEGKALSIQTIKIPCKEVPHDHIRHDSES